MSSGLARKTNAQRLVLYLDENAEPLAPETVEIPEWAEDYDNPVVERPGAGKGKCIHVPDLDADAPEPACFQAFRHTEWIVRERDPVEGWREYCHCPACKERLYATAPEEGDDGE
jgi:hypothetical protein